MIVEVFRASLRLCDFEESLKSGYSLNEFAYFIPQQMMYCQVILYSMIICFNMGRSGWFFVILCMASMIYSVRYSLNILLGTEFPYYIYSISMFFQLAYPAFLIYILFRDD